MIIDVNENECEEFLIEKLHINSINIYRDYLAIPIEGSPECENEEAVRQKLKEYIKSLKDSKRIIDILLDRALEDV